MKKIEKIVNALENGEIIILPTDTVYGIFADAYNIEAVKKIYKIKKRNFNKPLQVFFFSKKEIYNIADVNKKQKKYIEKYLPGPYTLILRLKKKYQNKFKFLKTNKIGVRIIKYKFLSEILKKLKKPLAATSANISGENSPCKFSDINPEIKNKIKIFKKWDRVVRGKPSTVIDLTDDYIKVLRK